MTKNPPAFALSQRPTTPRREPRILSWVKASATPVAASRYIAVLSLLTFSTGCASYPVPVRDAGQTKLVIQCLLKRGIEQATVLGVANDFHAVPGVIDVSAGYPPQTLHPKLPARAVTFIVTFKDERLYTQAMAGPEYARIRDQVLKPICSDFSEFGTTLQNYLLLKPFSAQQNAAAQLHWAAALRQQNQLRTQPL